ncbi:serine carboxypeptidase-domain-containing protein [Zopfochytrium polystomum]|nr:serine carboxypeptidase-domain-containing protein [Zopfochytrium polystomum]
MNASGFGLGRSGDFLFCEARWGGFPEWTSSTSASVIVLLGAFGTATTLVFNRNATLLLVLYSLMIANGVASFGAHFTGRVDWNRLDGFTLLVPGLILAPFLVHECMLTLEQASRNGKAAQSPRPTRSGRTRPGPLAPLWLLAQVVVFQLLTSGLVVALVDLGTVAEIGVYTVVVICLRRNAARAANFAQRLAPRGPADRHCRSQQLEAAHHYAILGGCVMTAGAIVWAVYEKRLCGLEPSWGRIPAHALWHIFAPYATYLFFQTTAYLLALRSRSSVLILYAKPSASWIEHALLAAAFIVRVTEQEEEEEEFESDPPSIFLEDVPVKHTGNGDHELLGFSVSGDTDSGDVEEFGSPNNNKQQQRRPALAAIAVFAVGLAAAVQAVSSTVPPRVRMGLWPAAQASASAAGKGELPHAGLMKIGAKQPPVRPSLSTGERNLRTLSFSVQTATVLAFHYVPSTDPADYSVSGIPIANPTNINGQYAGYIPVTTAENGTGSLFFWYFPSTDVASMDIVIWLNGGPGCSSMIGQFEENEPFLIQDDGSFIQNEYAWNTVANLLYVEQPVGTGFSFADKLAYNELEIADTFYSFIDGFYKVFSKTKDCDLYITGESYAGVYIPYIAQ